MTTINISLPEKLKDQIDALVDEGVYVSFSDAVRDSLREGLRKRLEIIKYERLFAEAKKDVKNGKAVVMRSKKDIENFVNSL